MKPTTHSLSQRAQSLPPAQAHQSKLYSKFAHLYDDIFTWFSAGIQKGLAALALQPGDKILEIGVGTGLSFPGYPKGCSVLGVDIAPAMLQRAQEKIEARGWSHLAVQQMSALDLALPDSSFDCVTAFHVVSVVQEAQQMMRELERVCRPGGKLLIVNYFCGEAAAERLLGDALDPLTRRLGWRSTLLASELLAKTSFAVERHERTSFLSPYRVVIAKNNK